jgi:outer membrane receptor protein involved in Fe transport
MKRYPILALIIFIGFTGINNIVKAQDDTNKVSEGSGTISGIVLDRASGQPLEAAVIGVYKMLDSAKVKGAETDNNGKFSVQVPYGVYKVEINFIGYNIAVVNNVSVTPRKPDVVLDIVKLRQGSAMTEEIEVTSERSSVELLPDKKVFNVGQDVINSGGSATDVLKNVPSVSVDVDGNVSLRGSGNVKILVDGKPSGLTGSTQSDILEQIPANMIESIELVTNPNAKYEAESSAGIINIVLKKNTGAFGTSGNFSLGAGTKDKYNGSMNLTMKNDKVNVYANYNYRLFNFGMTGTSTRQDFFHNTFLDQNSNFANRIQSHLAKVGLDYTIDPKNTISLTSTFNYRKRNRNEYTLNSDLDSSQTLKDYSVNNSLENSKGYGLDMGLNYSGFFNSPKQTLTGEISYSRSKNDGTDDINLQRYNPNGVPIGNFPNLQNTSTSTLQNYVNLQLDYVQPFGLSAPKLGKGKGSNKNNQGNNPKGNESATKLEAGVRSIFRSTDNDYVNNYFDSVSNAYVYNSNLSNHFKYNEQIHAAYLVFSSKIKDFSYQVGVRTEGTIAQGDLITNGQSFKNKYIDFFPNISVSQKVGLTNEIQASYSRKINRPRLNNLNPFVDISDPLNISVGNPNLQPEYSDSYELNFLKYFNTTTIEASAFYKQIHNNIVRTRYLTDTGVTVTTFQNLASSKSYGLELIAISQATPWLSFNGSVSYFKSVLNGQLNIGDVNNSNYSWNAKLSSSIKLWGGISMQLLYNYQGEFVTAQGTIKPVQTFDAAIKKDFLNNRASVSFRVSDIFNSQKFDSYTSGFGFTQNSYRKRDSRVAFLTLSFKLGSIDYKQRPDKNKKQDNNNNNDDINSPDNNN